MLNNKLSYFNACHLLRTGYSIGMTPRYTFALREGLENEDQFIPSRSEPLATGWDVRAAWNNKVSREIKFFEYVKIPLGIHCFCPQGWWFELKPRSSTFGNKNFHTLYGTIDETYEGELLFSGQFIPNMVFQDEQKKILDITSWMNQTLTIEFGEKIAQIVPVKRVEIETESCSLQELQSKFKQRNASRGSGGFGSTGNK